jgi:hypothetical protein
MLQNHRDYVAMTIIGSYGVGQWFQWVTQTADNDFIMQHIYTDDESDIAYREVNNKTDGAVRRKLTLAYADKIKVLRAEKERAA